MTAAVIRDLEGESALTQARITELQNDLRRATRRRDLAQKKADRIKALITELEQAQELRRGRIAEPRTGQR